MRRFGLIANDSKPEALRWATYVATRLIEERATVYVDEPLGAVLPDGLRQTCEVINWNEFEKFADTVITFGGDGTLLSAARLLIGTDIPIMGVNVGRLGFLAEFSMDAIDDALMDVLKGNYRIVDRTTLETTVDDRTFYALNEMLVERSGSGKMIIIRAFVDEHHVADYRADGVILTTPTGSTAYSLAAGGPIIAPSAQALCLTPISPHTLTLRPLIIHDQSEVRLEVIEEDVLAQLIVDGQIVAKLKQGTAITIRKSEHLVKLIKRADSTYFDLLREKLLWSADASRP